MWCNIAAALCVPQSLYRTRPDHSTWAMHQALHISGLWPQKDQVPVAICKVRATAGCLFVVNTVLSCAVQQLMYCFDEYQKLALADMREPLQCAGILMLSASDIKKAEREVLASALGKGCFELKQAPSLHVPAMAAVWALSSAEGASKSKSAVLSLTGNANAVPQVMQGALQHMGFNLFTAFDLALALDPDSLVADSCMDVLIDRQASSHAASSHTSGRVSSASSSSSIASSTRSITRQQLRQHMGEAASLPAPCISPCAVMMIQHYYALLRQQSPMQGPTAAAAVGTHTVASLLRMATASARLHMRHDAMAMPDAVLAIYMLQESLKAKVCHTLNCSAVL